jgi:hypothetical protein
VKKKIVDLLSTGWGRLGVIGWVVWLAYSWHLVDEEKSYYRWRGEDSVKWFLLGVVVPLVVSAAAWWVRLGFMSPEERARRKALRGRARREPSEAAHQGDLTAKKDEFDRLIKATGRRQTVADGLVAATDCVLCNTRFSFVSGKIELVEKNGQKGFLCQTCAGRVNDARAQLGLAPFEIWPGAYAEKEGRAS